jgi:iron-sulfur cluster assembly protein
MALDGPQEDDEIFDNDGITYVINRQLFESVKPIHVDFISTYAGSGFSISSSLRPGGSSGSACSC